MRVESEITDWGLLFTFFLNLIFDVEQYIVKVCSVYFNMIAFMFDCSCESRFYCI